MTTALTAQQLRQLETTERVASCFSLAGCAFVFFTFTYSPAFRKPVNRLIFYATWGNTLCNLGTLLSQAPIRAGRDSHVCQFQGFLIQMFLPADALWNLAMAINVYLTIFRRYRPEQLKSQEWKYHIMCYVLPFIVAFVCLFITTPDKGKMYGPASLWCWIDINWVVFRIALCYAPAWVAIISAFCIYALSGRELYRKRQELHAFNQPIDKNARVENPFTDYKTTEVKITSELAPISEIVGIAASSPIMEMTASHSDKRNFHADQYRSSLSTVTDTPPEDAPSQMRGLGCPSPVPSKVLDSYTVTIDSVSSAKKKQWDEESGPPRSVSSEHASSGPRTVQQRRHRAALEANTAALGYTKVALLFFVSLLITWVPSSVNRVYSLIHPDLISLPATFASSVVLPMMGFWNSVIYIVTSWAAVRALLTGRLGPGSRNASVTVGTIPSTNTNRTSSSNKSSNSDGAKQKPTGASLYGKMTSSAAQVRDAMHRRSDRTVRKSSYQRQKEPKQDVKNDEAHRTESKSSQGSVSESSEGGSSRNANGDGQPQSYTGRPQGLGLEMGSGRDRM